MTNPLKFCPLNVANLPSDLDQHQSMTETTTPSRRVPLFKRIFSDFKNRTQSWGGAATMMTTTTTTSAAVMSSSRVEPFGDVEDEDGSDRKRHYVPSPLSSPRRFGQRLSTKISQSPLLSRVRKRMDDVGGGGRFWRVACHHDDNTMMHDSGRIANRNFETKWDAWTTMGEDMTGDDDDDTSDSYSSSSSMDDFLQLPIDDNYGRSKRSLW